jgi:uncharacterized protein YukE
MADAWDALGSTLQAAERQLDAHADDVSTWWRGNAADAYATTWHHYSAGLPPLHQHIAAMSTTLRHASRTIQDAQDEYDHIVALVLAGAVVATAAAFFTCGLSEAGEAGLAAGEAGTAADLIATLGRVLAQVAADISEALATISRIAQALALALAGGGGGGGLALALAGGGTMTLGVSAAGATELVVGGTVVAVGAAEMDLLLAKAFGGSGGGGGGWQPGVTHPGDQVPREYTPDTDSLNHFAAKHGSDFGFPDKTPTVAERTSISDYVRNWIMDPAHQQIAGSYRGQQATIYLEQSTRRVLFTYPDGSFWGGWTLSQPQYDSLIATGGFR